MTTDTGKSTLKLGSAELKEIAITGSVRILLCEALNGYEIITLAIPDLDSLTLKKSENLKCAMIGDDKKCSLRKQACPNGAEPSKKVDSIVFMSKEDKAKINDLLGGKIAD